MKKYLVIGNPIEHSLSPQIHNHWFQENNIEAIYDKKKLMHDEIKDIISEVRNGKITGINVTVPFKRDVIPFLDKLSEESMVTQSVNTIYLENNKVIGHNTDIFGFEKSLKTAKFDIRNKKAFKSGYKHIIKETN